ncbi:protein TspB2 [Neisseria gonorrhoeae]|nr:protein TspB2 [Neisseria gonorrhoeae]
MNSFIKSTPIVLILILCSSNSYSEPVRLEKSQIKFQSSNNLKSIGFKLDSSSNTFSKFTEAANFEHIPTGAKARINAKITASVSRAGVLSGVGKLVRQGAKFGTRAVPYVGTALLAHDVYETFKEDIKARGCRYDPETDKFVKGYEYANCLWYEDERRINKTYGCYGVDSSIMRLMPDRSRFPEVKQLMESQMERIARPFWDKRKEEIPKDTALKWRLFPFSHCEFFWNGGGCFVRNGDNLIHRVYFKLERNPKYKEEMDAKKPEEILSLKVDADPDKYIKATGYPGYSEKVEVAPGTKVNMGPVTDRNGNPVQVAATFGRDAQGNTTADVQVIPRPDLTPASAEAPHAQPPPEVSPAENPANNPDPDENPGTRPNPEPDPDLNPDANPDTDGQPGTSPDSPAVPGPPKRQASQRKETRRRRRAFVRLFSGNPSLSGDGQTFGPHVSRYKHTAGYRR